jgi:transcriptional regulator with PAS, ATPase and Fis domain
MLFACGKDDVAEGVLSSARRDAVRADDRAGLARIEIAMAEGAVMRDQDARARTHLNEGQSHVEPIPPSIASRAWIVGSRLARAEGNPAPEMRREDPDATQEDMLDPTERLDLGAQLALERAQAARLGGDLAAARAHLERARELAGMTSSPRLIAVVDLEIGLYAADVDEPAAAYERIRHAIDVLEKAGLRRDAGRAMIELAEAMRASRVAEGEEAPALWLARAQEALGDAATWRDRSMIRAGFRDARASLDHAPTEVSGHPAGAYEQARGALLGELSVSVEAVQRALNQLDPLVARAPEAGEMQSALEAVRSAVLALPASVTSALGEVDQVVHGVFDGVEATQAELQRAVEAHGHGGALPLRYGFDDIAGKSTNLVRALAAARRAASTDATVLLTGERGTGKGIFAQAIHASGTRSEEPFLGIQVAGLPRDLLEVELFGFERPGASDARREGEPGRLEQAGGGTVLLEEIAELPLDLQEVLLRVLQERAVVRRGGVTPRPIRARVIATTQRDLSQLADAGKFRTDLLLKLRASCIDLSPLRERPQDIATIARRHLVAVAEPQGKALRELGPALVEQLARYAWPGNVRELLDLIEAEANAAPSEIRILDRLSTDLRLPGEEPEARDAGATDAHPVAIDPGPLSDSSPILPLSELERMAFLHAMQKSNQNVARAAEALGVSKVTFYSKLRSWGLHPKDRFDDEGPTNVRRARVASASAEPFEPPTRTARPKAPSGDK